LKEAEAVVDDARVRPSFLPSFFLCLFLGVFALPAAEPEIPFSFADGFIVVKAQVAGRAVRMLVDSGAGASVMSIRAARRLGLRMRDREMVRGVGSEVPAWHLAPVAASADGQPLASVELAIDLGNADQLCREAIDGLLGVDFFAERIVQIDFAARKLRLLSEISPGPAATRVPLTDRNGILCVPVGVNGSPLRPTRLDTGCNDFLHWVVPRAPSRTARREVSIGFLTDPSNTTLGTVQLGGEVLPSVKVALHAQRLFPGEAGLVGTGVLSRYLVTVDAVHRELILERPASRE
jgi:hypothetical protein